MLNKKGFSLLLFLLYLLLFTMVTFFSCHIIVTLIIPSLKSLRRSHSTIALHIATDLFVQDIRTINQERSGWKVIQSQELIWTSYDYDIGWRFNNNCLERIEGVYDQGWTKKTVSVVACNMSKVIFNAEKYNDTIIGIELMLRPTYDINKPVICYVALRQTGKNDEK